MSRTLRLVEHDAQWAARFEFEATRLREAVGTHVRAIEHVGSTAVEGLAGKPVLDIAIAVASDTQADACIAPIVSLGYEHRGAHGDDARRGYFVRDVDGARVTQIHLYVMPAVAWDNQLAFRDALRVDANLRAAYTSEKWRVAEAVAWNKSSYAVAKGAFIQSALAAIHRAADARVQAPGPDTLTDTRVARRRQLTLFVPSPVSATLERIRQELDPVQARLIRAHVTLCREDELDGVGFDDVRERLRRQSMSELALRFGPARIFAGHGVLLPCVGGEALFHQLRAGALGRAEIRVQEAHITLAHPRNPRAPANNAAHVAALETLATISFGTVSLIEQEPGQPWDVLDTATLS